MSGSGGPAEAPLLIRVGITGHRLNKLGPERLDAIREALRDAIGRVEAGIARICRTGVGFRIVSPLAEGADRLAVEAAPATWPLTAILPMPRADYERDFVPSGKAESASLLAFRAALAHADTILELPGLENGQAPAGDARNRQYAALGTFLVRHVDLLLAVWDGHDAAGPGGTALVVEEARALGVPVIWIDPARPSDILLSGNTTAGWAHLHGPSLDAMLTGLAARAESAASP